MKCVVTGAAGFIGSHLCEALLAAGHVVAGIDCFVPYYPRAVKDSNLAAALAHPRFRFHAADLRTDPLAEALDGAEAVFHLAAMPGLVLSWTDFDLYHTCNVVATQRLLEAVRAAKAPLRRFVLGSTSSVYGKFASGDETLPTCPVSPYGVTKLAAEHLCRAYASAYGLPLVVLRYFSVYGPRQRPDMGYHKFIRALLAGETILVTGDGHQSRSNTYIADCVEATILSLGAPVGDTYNVGGGEAASVWDILDKLSRLSGISPRTVPAPARLGDQRHTFADTSRLSSHLGWKPKTSLDEGLAAQYEWQEKLSAPWSSPRSPS
ncbi:MAG: GDP-mannose 4,6-dehydratase [Gemmataceae bacterium]|nr:GDP-mannose 4,6-dehydratase [Gemmataceae bacterium]